MVIQTETKTITGVGYRIIKSSLKKNVHRSKFHIIQCNHCNYTYNAGRPREVNNRCKMCHNDTKIGSILKNGTKIINMTYQENKENRNKYFSIICHCGNSDTISAMQLSKNLRRDRETTCKKCSHKARSLNLSKYDYDSFLNGIILIYETGAKARNLEYSLTRNDVKTFINSNCHYCGDLPDYYKRTTLKNANFKRNGIDRIDSELGYIKNNCIPCCKNCNSMKLNLRQKEFLEQVNKIYKHQH